MQHKWWHISSESVMSVCYTCPYASSVEITMVTADYSLQTWWSFPDCVWRETSQTNWINDMYGIVWICWACGPGDLIFWHVFHACKMLSTNKLDGPFLYRVVAGIRSQQAMLTRYNPVLCKKCIPSPRTPRKGPWIDCNAPPVRLDAMQSSVSWQGASHHLSWCAASATALARPRNSGEKSSGLIMLNRFHYFVHMICWCCRERNAELSEHCHSRSSQVEKKRMEKYHKY